MPSHSDLIQLAIPWLCSRFDAPRDLVLVEPKCSFTRKGESPDILLWVMTKDHGFISVVGEVKRTKGDASADDKKWHRADSWRGCGNYRFWIAEEEAYNQRNVPDYWSGVMVRNGECHLVCEGEFHHNHNREWETALLWTAWKQTLRAGKTTPSDVRAARVGKLTDRQYVEIAGVLHSDGPTMARGILKECREQLGQMTVGKLTKILEADDRFTVEDVGGPRFFNVKGQD